MKQTFTQFIAEARKNPEQNPKVSINQEIDQYAGSDPKNAFISFTKVDKLGINPQSGYDTPLGIYAYPVDYVQKETEDGQWMRVLPFAGRSEYATLFRPSGNIVELDTLSVLEARGYYKKLSDLWVKMSGTDWKTSVDQVERILNNAHELALFPDYVGGRFWYIVREIAYLIAGARGEGKVTVIWNKVFREIGIDGCVDRGIGIIHSNEPNQGVFFSIAAISDTKRVYNKWSPEAMEWGQELGAEKVERMRQATERMKGMGTEQIVAAFSRGALPLADINYIRDRHTRLAVLGAVPTLIRYILNPTTDEQTFAIKNDPTVISNTLRGGVSDQAIINCIQESSSTDVRKIIHQVLIIIRVSSFTPSLALYKLLLEVDFDGFSEISLYRDIPHQIVRLALRRMDGQRLPSWLIVAARKYGLK